jgi:hypothetical protein
MDAAAEERNAPAEVAPKVSLKLTVAREGSGRGAVGPAG